MRSLELLLKGLGFCGGCFTRSDLTPPPFKAHSHFRAVGDYFGGMRDVSRMRRGQDGRSRPRREKQVDPREEYFAGLCLGKERAKSGVTKPMKQGSALCILCGGMLHRTLVSFSWPGIRKL